MFGSSGGDCLWRFWRRVQLKTIMPCSSNDGPRHSCCWNTSWRNLYWCCLKNGGWAGWTAGVVIGCDYSSDCLSDERVCVNFS